MEEQLIKQIQLNLLGSHTDGYHGFLPKSFMHVGLKSFNFFFFDNWNVHAQRGFTE